MNEYATIIDDKKITMRTPFSWLIATTQKRELVSKAYTAVPALPLNYTDAPEFFADGLNYPVRNVWRILLNKAVVCYNGAIYTPWRILPESAISWTDYWQKQYLHGYSLKQYVKDVIKKRFQSWPASNYILIADEWSTNHYHFHVDCLPKLLAFSKEDLNRATLLLPRTAYLQKNALELLKLFDLNVKEIKYIEVGQRIKLPRSTFVPKAVEVGFVPPHQMQQLKARVHVAPRPDGPSRIYIKRQNPRFRTVLNEADVEQVVTREFGFTVVDFEQYSITEQIALVANATIMLGMHGAGLTNIFYATPGTTLVEFRRTGMHHHHCYWHLAAAVGARYAVVFGEPDDASKVLEGNGCNLTVHLDHLREVLRALA